MDAASRLRIPKIVCAVIVNLAVETQDFGPGKKQPSSSHQKFTVGFRSAPDPPKTERALLTKNRYIVSMLLLFSPVNGQFCEKGSLESCLQLSKLPDSLI